MKASRLIGAALLLATTAMPASAQLSLGKQEYFEARGVNVLVFSNWYDGLFADSSYIAGGVVPGVLIVKPDLPENSEQWPFFWGENEYVVNLGPSYIALVHAANDVAKERRGQ